MKLKNYYDLINGLLFVVKFNISANTALDLELELTIRLPACDLYVWFFFLCKCQLAVDVEIARKGVMSCKALATLNTPILFFRMKSVHRWGMGA